MAPAGHPRSVIFLTEHFSSVSACDVMVNGAPVSDSAKDPVAARIAAVGDRTPEGIARELARLVTDGVLVAGDRLPTVREVAAALSVSPATVSAAWQALARAGVIVSRGRAGSFVRAPRRAWLTPRVKGLSGAAPAGWDLASGMPDPALLPPLGAAFERVDLRAGAGRYRSRHRYGTA